MKYFVNSGEDLEKRIFKTDTCVVYFPDIDLEIQPNDETEEKTILETLQEIEKNLKFVNMMGTIGEDLKVRESNSDKHKNSSISDLEKMISGEMKFSIELRDESGNSFIEDLQSVESSPYRTIKDIEMEIESRSSLLDAKYSNELLQKAFEKYSTKDFLGVREQDTFKYYSYQEIYQRVCNFSGGIKKILPERSFVGIYADTCLEWFVADLALQFCGFIVVPIHSNLDEFQLKSIIFTTKLVAIICDEKCSKIVQNVYSEVSTILQHVIKIDEKDDKLSFRSIEKSHENVESMKVAELKPDDIVTLVYTSGSSGTPKGVIHTEYMWLETLKKHSSNELENIYASFSPLSHLTARMKYLRALMIGGKVGLANPDNLLEEVKMIEPTSFVAPPRIFNFIFQQYQEELKITNETILRERYSNILGRNLKRIVVGGSKINPKVSSFIEGLFGIPVFDTYGTSETMGIMHSNRPMKNVDLKLVSVPELGYLVDDKPNPRGEIIVKSNMISPGYYGIDEKMNVDEDGYYHTGDVGEKFPNGEIFIIDRKTNFFKLQNSEWISPERIEGLISNLQGVKQVFVFPNNEKTALFAILVPNTKKSDETMLREVKLFLRGKLPSYEIPDRLIHVNKEFTLENELLTPSMKLCRPKLMKFFASEIEDMNKNFELENISIKNSLIESISNVFDFPIDSNKNFQELGGDSLSAVKIINIIEKKFKVKVTSQEIYQNDFIQCLMNKINEKESEIEEINYELPDDVQPLNKEPMDNNEVFLTGATGFLGEFLLNDLLKEGWSVHCLIRNHKKSEMFIEKYSKFPNVNFVFGDLGKPKLGLEPKVYEELSKKVSKVYHAGASVNHLYPFSLLKNANVDGTIELLRFSVTNEMKYFNYISSTSVYSGTTDPITEDFDISSLKGKAKGGYSKSKFVAEYIVQEGRKRKIPVTIFRPGMISASYIDGTCNPADWITGLIKTFMNYSEAPIQSGVLEMCPVDFISTFIVQVSKLNTQKNYNLVHPHVGIDYGELFTTLGVKCDKTYTDWYEEMKLKDEIDNRIFKLLPTFSKGIPLNDDFVQHVGMSETAKMMEKLNIKFEKLDKEYIEKMLKYMKATK